jgi:hypothetical protein
MLSVSPEFLGVSTSPRGSNGGSLLGGNGSLLEETSGLLAGGGLSSEFSVGHLAGADPVDARVVSDSGVVGIDHDDFVEFVRSILSNPVGVEDSEVRALAANTLFSSGLVSSLLLELADTLVDGLSEDGSLSDGTLSSSTSDADSVDNVTLSSLVSELSGLIGSGRSLALVDDGKLSVFPGSDSEDETEEIGLLSLPHFFEVLVGSHNNYKV